MQLEPPDFLRSHYQSFQKLAYHLKRKNPELRRNVKFCDVTLSLTMDVLIRPGAEWRTVLCDDAKAILRKARERLESIFRDGLEELVEPEPLARKRRRTIDDDSSDMEDENDVTIVENDNETNNSTKHYRLSPSLMLMLDC